MGPAGLVSVDDSEMMEFSQTRRRRSIPTAPPCSSSAAATSRDAPHMITETAIRGFYRYYREVMEL